MWFKYLMVFLLHVQYLPVQAKGLIYDVTEEDPVKTTFWLVNVRDSHLAPRYYLYCEWPEGGSLNLQLCGRTPLIEEKDNLEIVIQSNTTEVFDQVTPTTMVKEQCKGYQYVLAGNKLRPADIAKVKS